MPDDEDESGPENRARLTRGSIRGHLISQTAPAIVGVGALMSIGIIDAYFIGQLGPDPLAAVAFIFPVTTALASLGVGVMVGVSSVVSRALGRGEDDHARGLANLGIFLAIGLGFAMAAALFALRGPLFRLMQADAALLPLIDAYMAPYAIGFVLLLPMMALNGSLRAQGAAKRSMAILLAMAVTNWILDPILIVGAFGIGGLGVAGAAYATLISWVVSGLVGFVLLQSTDIHFNPASLKDVEPARDTGAIARVTGPAAFSNSINPVGLAILTALLASAGAAEVAGFGAGGRLQAFVTVPLLALSGSIGAIVGQNWGAEKVGRARSALLQAGVFSVGYGLATGLIVFVFREDIAALFTDDPTVKRSLAGYLAISAWGYGGYGVFIVASGAFNAIDRAGVALLQALARVVLVMVPVALAASALLGADGIYWAELAANLVGGLVAAAIAARLFRKEQ